MRAGGLGERVVGVVECGASFTVAATVDNVLLFWGTRWHTSLVTHVTHVTS